MPPGKSKDTHPNKSRKVPTREKFAYGVGHVLNDMVTSFLLSYIAVYVTVGLKVGVSFAGYTLFVILITDALSRPVIMVLSRKLPICCYFGRRKSWHLFGSVLLAASVMVIFTFLLVPEEDEWPRFLVYVPVFIVLAIAFTCAQVSHKAILREMTGLTSEKNLLSAWRSISALAANMSVFVVTAILLSTSGDVSSSAFSTGDANTFSYISYFILVTGGCCCIAFYTMVPEKTQTCGEAREQCIGCCYRLRLPVTYRTTKASNLRRQSNIASLSNPVLYRKRSLSGGQSDKLATTSLSLPPINRVEDRAKSPRSLSKTGHLIINVQKVEGSKGATSSKTKMDGTDSTNNGTKAQGNMTSTNKNNSKTNIGKPPDRKVQLDLKKTASVVVATRKMRENVRAKTSLSVAGATGSRTSSPCASGSKGAVVMSTSRRTCCICPWCSVKVADNTTSGAKRKNQATVKSKSGQTSNLNTKNGHSSETSRSCCWCCTKDKGKSRSEEKEKRDCCPWFKGMCKKPKFFKAAVIHACSKLAFLIAQVYMPLYLTESLAMHKISTAVVPLVVYMAGFVATLVTSRINAKYGRKRTFAIGEACVLGASVWLFFIPVETSSQVYATACLLGVGLSTLQVRSVAMMTDLTGSPVDAGAAVFGVNEKAIQAIAILLLHVLSPCRLNSESDDCKAFYRSIMLSMTGGSTFISFLVLALAKVFGIDDDGVEVSDGNAIEISSNVAV